ncbi:MAG: RcnB family protein [Bdellovibrionales bacterium]|nr:RcnB family protein [Ramlibacter sp.]
MPGYLGPNIDRVDRDRVNRDRVERERIERERVERVNRGSRFGGYDSRRAENEARRPDYNWRERDYNVRRPEFRQGDRIPEQFRSRQYVVNNWQSHGLQQPPRGHEWVQVGADYALVAIGSGVIAALVLTN